MSPEFQSPLRQQISANTKKTMLMMLKFLKSQTLRANNIPPEEDVERAIAADERRNRGLGEVCERILHRFGDQNVHKCFLFYSQKTDTFRAYVFYHWASQIDRNKKSGLSANIEQAVIDELEKVGRGDRSSLVVEFDSQENVDANFEGNYFLRLR